MQTVVRMILYFSDLLVPFLIFYIVAYGIMARRPVYDDFVRGGKGRISDSDSDYAYADWPDGGGRRPAGIGIS